MVYVYKNDPNIMADIAETVNNMIYADYFHIRAEIDKDYSDTYVELQKEQASAAVDTKFGMTVSAPLTGGMSVFWGADLICAAHVPPIVVIVYITMINCH